MPRAGCRQSVPEKKWCPFRIAALQHQVREPRRLLGKKTLENKVLHDALELTQ
jgi:hypothetical protein